MADSTKGGVFDEELCFGEGFGMISAYFKRPIPSTVTARTPLELYVLFKDDFLKALAADTSFEPRIRSALLASRPELSAAAAD
ncbi:MAG: hypothetical protein ACLP7Q_12655 [Isosphaeraceae bacterium]